MFQNTQKIRFDEVDGAGILYYPRFFDLCHRAFEDMFDEQGPFPYAELVTKRRQGFPAVNVTSSFFAPLTYGELATVTLHVAKIGNSSLVTRYDIHRQTDGMRCFEADITTVLMDLDLRRAVPIANELRSFLESKAR